MDRTTKIRIYNHRGKTPFAAIVEVPEGSIALQVTVAKVSPAPIGRHQMRGALDVTINERVRVPPPPPPPPPKKKARRK